MPRNQPIPMAKATSQNMSVLCSIISPTDTYVKPAVASNPNGAREAVAAAAAARKGPRPRRKKSRDVTLRALWDVLW